VSLLTSSESPLLYLRVFIKRHTMPPIKILILTANPRNTDRLQLEQEIREIKAELDRSTLRDQFEIITEGAVRVTDLSHALLRHAPTVVHFSGHGAGENGLVLENDKGDMQLVPTDALVELFRLHKTTVKCVFLNACYSEVQANAIYQQIDCVVGMNQAIGDKTAIQFSPKFYAALSHGRSFQDAFDSAKNFLQLDKNREVSTPILKIRQGAANLFPESRAIAEPAPIAPPDPAPQTSMSIGNISITGNSNAPNFVQGDGNTISQNFSQSVTSSDLQTAIAALAQLKEAIATTNVFSPRVKHRARGGIEFIEAEIQKLNPDKSEVEQAIGELQETLGGTMPLAKSVEKIIELIAKI
jgi:CHAT domain